MRRYRKQAGCFDRAMDRNSRRAHPAARRSTPVPETPEHYGGPATQSSASTYTRNGRASWYKS